MAESDREAEFDAVLTELCDEGGTASSTSSAQPLRSPRGAAKVVPVTNDGGGALKAESGGIRQTISLKASRKSLEGQGNVVTIEGRKRRKSSYLHLTKGDKQSEKVQKAKREQRLKNARCAALRGACRIVDPYK